MIHSALDTVKTGELQGSVNNTTPTQLPDVPCVMAKLKAVVGNTGNFYIGGSAVTVPDGNADATTGYELDATQETDWLPISNLNKLYLVSDVPGDKITYIALR